MAPGSLIADSSFENLPNCDFCLSGRILRAKSKIEDAPGHGMVLRLPIGQGHGSDLLAGLAFNLLWMGW